jgi:hypothetical protein
MTFDFRAQYLEEVLRVLRQYKRLGDDAVAQLDDEQFFAVPDPESNSVAIIVKHIAGNLRSRFTDFLTSDGERPDRNRDQEFIVEGRAARTAIIQDWEKQWQLLFATVQSLGPDDLARTITIRAQPHSVVQALSRSTAHLAYHTGQIVFLAKHWKSAGWKTLSVAKGQSEQFTAEMRKKHAGTK